MIALLRRFAAGLAAAAAFALPASAATQFSPDYTDAWQVPGEAGYGVFINQQGATMFVALFVYGGDTLPRWYFASNVTGSSQTLFSGQLFRSQGTSFAAPWNPASLQVVPVGTVTLSFASPTQGVISYTVDNVPVQKTIVRNGLPRNSLAGTFIGTLSVRASNCSGGTPSTLLTIGDTITVQDSGGTTNPRFIVDFITNSGAAASCAFTGTYTASGRVGNVDNGAFTCAGGTTTTGTFSMSELQVNQNGISGKVNMRDNACTYAGFIGGARAAQ